MWILVISLLELAAPPIDSIDDFFFSRWRHHYVGEIVVIRNDRTEIQSILDRILIHSADKVRPWKLVTSECLLLFQHFWKFDLHAGKRPRIRLEDVSGSTKFRNVVIDFPERSGLGDVKQKREEGSPMPPMR
jgi:hypothetical protein